jgi:hypothetical protein
LVVIIVLGAVTTFFLKDTLSDIKTQIQNENITIGAIKSSFDDYKVLAEGRFSKIEIISFIDSDIFK